MSTNLKWTIFLFFIFGACCAGRYSTAYVYLIEMVPSRHQNIAGSFSLFADAAVFVVVPLYFMLVSKDWIPLQLFAIAATLATLIATLFIPESPKFLYSKNRFHEARKALL